MMKAALLLCMVSAAAAVEITHVSCDYDNSADRAVGRSEDSPAQGFATMVHVDGVRPGQKVGLTGDSSPDGKIDALFNGEGTCAEWGSRMSVYPWVVGGGSADDEFWFKNADEFGTATFRVPTNNCDDLDFLLAVGSDSQGYCDSSNVVHFGNLAGVFVTIELTEYPATYTWTKQNEEAMAEYVARILSSDRDNTPEKNSKLADEIQIFDSRGGINLPSHFEHVTTTFAPNSYDNAGSMYVSAIVPCVDFESCHKLKRQIRQSFKGDVSNDRLADFLGGDKFKVAEIVYNELYRSHD